MRAHRDVDKHGQIFKKEDKSEVRVCLSIYLSLCLSVCLSVCLRLQHDLMRVMYAGVQEYSKMREKAGCVCGMHNSRSMHDPHTMRGMCVECTIHSACMIVTRCGVCVCGMHNSLSMHDNVQFSRMCAHVFGFMLLGVC